MLDCWYVIGREQTVRRIDMPRLTTPNPIDQLILLKFPLAGIQPFPDVTVGARQNAAVVRDQRERAKKLRAELEELPLEEVEKLLADEKAKSAQKLRDQNAREERLRFFNQESAKSEFGYWSKMSYWSLDECVALSLGRDPRIVSWERVKSLTRVSSFAAAYESRREVINRAKVMEQLWDHTIPSAFLAWAQRMQVSIPNELVIAVQQLGVQVRDWKTAHDEQKQRAEETHKKLLECMECRSAEMQSFSEKYEVMSGSFSEAVKWRNERIKLLEDRLETIAGQVAPTEKSLSTRERESLLKLVIGMAIGGYAYDPKASRTSTASEIAGDLQLVNLSLDQDTVRKYLQEGRDLLPGDEAE